MNSALVTEKIEDRLYSMEEQSLVNRFPIPKHVAIIMDGNRRWAKRQGLPPLAGHWRGAERLVQIVRAAAELGIEVLTVYAFSTENWQRPTLEVRALMRLFKAFLQRQRPYMEAQGVRFSTIGDLSKFPEDVQKEVAETVEATKHGERFELVIALNYGGRDEITRALKSIVSDCLENKLAPENISEDLIGSYLDTAKWRDPDLLIRTSGESRVSNFLLWQISYSEVFVTNTLWPDFCEKHLLGAVLEYQKREMRLGK